MPRKRRATRDDKTQSAEDVRKKVWSLGIARVMQYLGTFCCGRPLAPMCGIPNAAYCPFSSVREIRLMTVQDEHLTILVKAAATTERHHFALGVANALRCANSVEGPSARELGEAEEALVAWKAADRALTAYQASERWAPTRD